MPYYYRTSRQNPMQQTAIALQRVLKPFPFAEANGLPPATTLTLETPPGAAGAPAEASTTLREAATLVGSAASILNEDMAAGVLAARQARADGPLRQNSSRLPGPDFKMLLREAHDFVDAISAVLPKLQGGATDWLGSPENHAIKAEDITQLEQKTARAGDVARINIKLHNDNAESIRLVPHCTSLLGDTGYRITEERLTFTPSQIQLGADESASVALDVSVPDDCAKGLYAGIVKVSGAPHLCAVVSLEVV
jgi:hypothetical protein